MKYMTPSNYFRGWIDRMIVASVVLTMTVIASFAQQPGDLDPTFGNGGLVLGPQNAVASSMAQLPDGKLIVVGNSSYACDPEDICIPNSEIVIARYNPNGLLDTTFGGDGVVITQGFPFALDVAVQVDGKMVVAGGYNGLNIARFNSDGSLDTTFGVDGFVSAPFIGAYRSGFNSVAIQPDGKIVAAGFAGFLGNDGGWTVVGDDFVLVRCNVDGSLDTTFSGDGILTTDIGSGFEDFDRASSVVIQPDGKILAVGHATTGSYPTFFDNLALVRYNPNGSPDTTFSGDGIATTTLNYQNTAWASSIAIQPDGRIVAAGSIGLFRFNTNGSPDASFDSDGIVMPGANRVAIQPDGKIVTGNSGALARYNPNGSLDTDFGGGDGTSTFDVDGNDMLLDGQGRAVVVGESNGEFALARFLLKSTSTITVTNTNDGGVGSLRQAIADAAPGDTINFSGGIAGGTITLTSGRLLIDKNITIQGLGAELLSISGNNAFSVFFINSGSTVEINAVTIRNGRSIAGGGIWNQGTLAVSNCTISENTANADPDIGGGGGGIYNAYGAVVVRNSNISGNSAIDSGGGGIFSGSGGNAVAMVTVINSTISNNTSAFGGGGIFNRAFDGQAILNVTNTTISGNSTGIYSQGSTKLINSIVAANTLGDIVAGTIDSASHNLIGDAASSGGIVNGVNGNIVGVNPLLGPLQNNGGPTLTHALLPGSPAINAGDNCVLTENGCGFPHPALPTDQRGFARVGAVDIGAFELQSNVPPKRVRFDFDGDGKADIAVFRPSGGQWWVRRSFDRSMAGFPLGLAADIPVPADFTGDGIADIAVFRPSNGTWYILGSDGGYRVVQFGQAGDVPVPGDHDGDGKHDLVVFRPSNGTWYWLGSTGIYRSQQFGAGGDIPVPGDYDGDGKNDLAVFRPSSGTWYANTSGGSYQVQQFGAEGDIPAPGDYDGDGKADLAVFRPSSGSWYVHASTGYYDVTQFGENGDVPVAADYDGDAKTDRAVFRPSTATWFIQGTSGPSYNVVEFGTSGDVPVSGAMRF